MYTIRFPLSINPIGQRPASRHETVRHTDGHPAVMVVVPDVIEAARPAS